jgi:hypothetical protein
MGNTEDTETEPVSPDSQPLSGWHTTGLIVGFTVILTALAFVGAGRHASELGSAAGHG